MSEITPEQLMQAASGDERALAGIISKMMPQLRFGVMGFANKGLEEEDLVQEGLIGLMHAVDTYKSEKGSRFETYASHCIHNAQITAVRKASRKKYAPLNESVSLNEQDASVPGPEDSAIEREQLILWNERFRLSLSERERKVLMLFMQGCTVKQISDYLHCTQKAAETALARARRKLRLFL